jgi:leader peptidase (prepilin peptidase)/N-methyltransferase
MPWLQRFTQNAVNNKVFVKIGNNKVNSFKVWTAVITIITFITAYLKLGFTIKLFEALTLTSLLIIISIKDLKTRIISDYMILISLIIGIIFIFILDKNLIDCLAGMTAGGVIMLLLALIPGVMGGGDVKLMFAVGVFLGFNRIIYAIAIAFIAAALISVCLLALKIAGRKDHIPFGPFLALGSFIALLFI